VKSAIVAAAEAREAKLLRPIEVKQPELSLQDAAFEMLSEGLDWDTPSRTKSHMSNGFSSKPLYERNNNYDDGQSNARGTYRSVTWGDLIQVSCRWSRYSTGVIVDILNCK